MSARRTMIEKYKAHIASLTESTLPPQDLNSMIEDLINRAHQENFVTAINHYIRGANYKLNSITEGKTE